MGHLDPLVFGSLHLDSPNLPYDLVQAIFGAPSRVTSCASFGPPVGHPCPCMGHWLKPVLAQPLDIPRSALWHEIGFLPGRGLAASRYAARLRRDVVASVAACPLATASVGSPPPQGVGAVKLLDPTLDVVFKLLLVRRPELLEDMLSCILGRPVGPPTILDPTILGEHVRDKRSILDLRVSLGDGTRADLEMQKRVTPMLIERLVYYLCRDYADQLRQGDGYEELTPSTSIVWLGESLGPGRDRLHTVVKLRDEQSDAVLTEHLSFHLLQLTNVPISPLPRIHVHDYDAQVERWARFFTARRPIDFHHLAAENRIMSLAKQTLDALSKDLEAQRLTRMRLDAKFYDMSLAKSRRESEAKGRLEGQAALLLKQLGLRFGPLSEATRSRVAAATSVQLELWAERVLTARSLEELLGP